MEKMYPMLFTTWKTYSKEQFLKDLIAGIVVAIIALPLSIALALASGVGPEQGIYTAIVAALSSHSWAEARFRSPAPQQPSPPS